jgi:hypothetical protein
MVVKMMTEYLVYPIQSARYAGPTQIIACETDDEAIEQAKTLLEGYDLEVWDEGRFVAAIQLPGSSDCAQRRSQIGCMPHSALSPEKGA